MWLQVFFDECCREKLEMAKGPCGLRNKNEPWGPSRLSSPLGMAMAIANFGFHQVPTCDMKDVAFML